ncbi:pimeloyl-ACP methyl ester carboxylesterase [Nocardia transvalensis]|uniref:Pimeloyl-ACP methyl ester carboxylesterase n=1 Tax=Nocardia transvalensis TaxID=37333 RepID=A0A7W9UG08_9NOCA|nr:alpha/beta hydrolase [Nocardia transvalensis]MBB5911778.1 pimeloyl-ACP methyl ester carboxylesterase [Nocardia transvalensis]
MTTSDGRRLHAMVLPGPEGARGPAVVFESGAAVSRSLWALIQPLVGEWSRTIVYDRSGLGRSAPDPRSRTLERMAGDLGEVLDHFGAGPYVLVAHSAGGPIVRAVAAAKLERIAGLVLVDPTDEGQDALFTSAFRKSERRMLSFLRIAARTKVLPYFYRSTLAALPPDARRDMRREGFTAQAMRTFADQQRTYLDDVAAYRENPPALGDLPVTIISAGRAGSGIGEDLRTTLNAAHARSASRSPHGRHVIAEHSDHYVLLSEPDLVADEIRRLTTPPVPLEGAAREHVAVRIEFHDGVDADPA